MNSDNSKIICVYGPQASGKTRFSKQIAKHYGCKRIVEVDDMRVRPVPITFIGKIKDRLLGEEFIQPGDLLLTNQEPRFNKGFRYIPIDQALREAGIK